MTTKSSPSRTASDVCGGRISRADRAKAGDWEGALAWDRGCEARAAEEMGGHRESGREVRTGGRGEGHVDDAHLRSRFLPLCSPEGGGSDGVPQEEGSSRSFLTQARARRPTENDTRRTNPAPFAVDTTSPFTGGTRELMPLSKPVNCKRHAAVGSPTFSQGAHASESSRPRLETRPDGDGPSGCGRGPCGCPHQRHRGLPCGRPGRASSGPSF